MYDMFVGGVSGSGESSLQTLLRELKEEIGLDFTMTTQIEIDQNGKNREGACGDNSESSKIRKAKLHLKNIHKPQGLAF